MSTLRALAAIALALPMFVSGYPAAGWPGDGNGKWVPTSAPCTGMETAPLYKTPGYSPYAGRNYPEARSVG